MAGAATEVVRLTPVQPEVRMETLVLALRAALMLVARAESMTMSVGSMSHMPPRPTLMEANWVRV